MSILARLRSAPFALSLFTATAKTAAADVVTQKYLEDAQYISMRRVGVFTLFGFWYLGGFQYFLYVRLFSKWFPHAKAFGEHATIRARINDAAGLKDLFYQVWLAQMEQSRSDDARLTV